MSAERLWVLDTSVVVSWFFEEEARHREACMVQRHCVEYPEHYLVPCLLHAELVHVLARKSACDRHFVQQAMRIVLRLGLRTLFLSQAAMERSVHWCCLGLSGYDATYAALAEDFGACWLTADDRAPRLLPPGLAMGLEERAATLAVLGFQAG